MNPLTPEQKKDVETRVDAFRKGYVELVEKYQVDFVSYPQWVQNPNGAFLTVSNMTIVDKKFMPIPSPMQDGGDSVIKS